MTVHHVPAHLAEATYVRVTTFRKDGTPVPTPVWSAVDGGDLVFVTGHGTGKVKRLARTARVLVAPCDARGRVKDGVEDVEATADVVRARADVDAIAAAIKAKYGFQVTMIRLLHKLRGRDDPSTDVGVRMRLAPDQTSPAAPDQTS